MLDGAAKIGKLAARADELGMPAVAMTDHGNMFGAYEFHRERHQGRAQAHHRDRSLRRAGVAVPQGSRCTGASRTSGRPMRLPAVAGTCRRPAPTCTRPCWPPAAQGLRNLFKISSLASLEGHYRKWPRMDDELLDRYHEGIIATTGCPSGAVQTRLRLGQYDEALNGRRQYQDIFGKENYFLELMDHGIPIETAVREDLLQHRQAPGHPAAGHQRLPLRDRGPGQRPRRAAVRGHQLPG